MSQETAPTGAELVDVPDGLDEFNEWAIQNRWSDGLPLVPPTPDRIDRMLMGTDWDRDRAVAPIGPRFAEATVESIAANAVMAGCRPSAMPVLIAAVEGLSDPAVNTFGAQATTHPCGLMVMVTGAVAQHAGISGGSNLFGNSLAGNVTIGRAARLILQNVGGSWPGESDRSTQGSPSKISFCFAENEEDSPWEPYRISRGYALEDSTVSVVFGEAPHNLNDHVSTHPAGLAFMMAQTIATVGKNNPYCRDSDYVVVVCPEHARTLAKHEWTRSDLQEYLYERARIPYRDWRRGAMFEVNPHPRYLDAADDDLQVRIVDSPDDIHVVVGGGPGLHSAWIPTFGLTKTVTTVVRDAAGAPMRFDGA